MRMILAIGALATLIGATAPAFAINEVTNCSAAPKSDWARGRATCPSGFRPACASAPPWHGRCAKIDPSC